MKNTTRWIFISIITVSSLAWGLIAEEMLRVIFLSRFPTQNLTWAEWLFGGIIAAVFFIVGFREIKKRTPPSQQ